MKNFHMPEIISPTLETEELNRLHKSITLIRSKEEADHIVNSLPLTNNSTPEERAKWVENLSILLENTYDTNTIKQIRQRCYCTENGTLEKTANSLKELFHSHGCDLHKFVDTLNENGAGWYLEGHDLYTKMFSCPCPMLEKSKISNSLTWCHCTSGYGKHFFEIVFGVTVDAEILHSMRQGFGECLVKITLPQDFIIKKD